MRFKAPEHVSDITLSTGPLAVVDGYAEAPDDLSEGDLSGLVANGFVRDDTPAPTPAPVSSKPSVTAPTPVADKG